jgi:hypothetical protein
MKSPVQASRVCPDCRGEGSITLLVSRTRCDKCRGSGRFDPTECDAPLGATDLLSVRARKCLERIGVTTLRAVATLTEAQVACVPHMTEVTLREIKGALRRFGLSLRG